VSSHGTCDEVRQALAVYVLGAIAPADRAVADLHLAECANCRSELAGLAALPALLGRVSPQEASALVDADLWDGQDNPPSGQALRHLLTSAARHRRQQLRRGVAIAGAAGLLAGAGVIAGWQSAHSSPELPLPAAAADWSVTPRAVNPGSHVSATVRYTATAWGLALSVQVSGIPVGTMCRLDVIGTAGQVTPAGGWIITSGMANWYPASSGVAQASVRSFAVKSGTKVLVTVPVKDRAPQSPPVR
jgi:Putative zinc-finger